MRGSKGRSTARISGLLARASSHAEEAVKTLGIQGDARPTSLKRKRESEPNGEGCSFVTANYINRAGGERRKTEVGQRIC